MMNLKAAWITFLCWFLEHRMVLIAEDVSWHVWDKLKECGRCGHQEFTRETRF